MFGRIKNIIDRIRLLNGSVDDYRQDSIIQSLPTVAYVNKAKKLIDKCKYTEAEELLKKALDISDKDSKVYKYLGKIREVASDFQTAIEYYHNSAFLNPQDKEIWLRLGMCQLSSMQLDDAITSFERANKITPFNTDVYTGWGMALMRQKKYALAHDKFLEASKISKYNFTAILLSAVMEVRLCDYDSAEVKLKFLAKVAPNEGSTYEYANLKLLKSDYKEAEKYAQKTIGINKQMLPAYFILGEVYSIQKDLKNTDEIFSKAIENGLENETLHLEWGKAYVRFFDFENAKRHFLLALDKNPDYIDAKIGLALVNAYDNDFALVEDLKEKYGSNVYIQEAIGLDWLNKGLYDDAVEMFKKALRTDAKQTYNYLNIARVYKILQNKTKVKEYFDKFICEEPTYVPAMIEYSKWLIEQNDFAEAQRKLRKAEKLDSDNVEMLNLLFFTVYTLVKNNICEYNIKEAILIANKVKSIGKFDYEPQRAELESILKDMQGR